MSVELYDNALLQKLKNWTTNSNITITGTAETSRLFEIIADNNNDKSIALPLISISRPGGYTILSTSKKPLTFDGISLDATKAKSIQLNAIPISINYQIDIYTKYLAECDEYSRNLIFNLINYPKLEIVLPYNDKNILHDANITLLPDVVDNSDIPERIIAGQFSRFSIQLAIDDAYLFDVRARNNVFISHDDIEIR